MLIIKFGTKVKIKCKIKNFCSKITIGLYQICITKAGNVSEYQIVVLRKNVKVYKITGFDP